MPVGLAFATGGGGGNMMERGYLWGRGDRVRHRDPKASLGLGAPLDVSGPGAFLLPQTDDQTTSRLHCLDPSNA